MIDTVADFVASVTEVAVTVTVLPVGTAAGAVYVVAAPLAVVAGLKLPQGADDPVELQVTVHFTPAFAASFITFAVIDAVVEISSEDGGADAKLTDMTCCGGMIVIVCEADFVASVTEVAVTVTVLLVGTAAGAVYVVVLPLAVVEGLKLPQAALPQLTVHRTPAFAESLFTLAASCAVAEVCSDVTVCDTNTTEIAAGGFGVLLVPPVHPTASTISIVAIITRMHTCRRFIVHLRTSPDAHGLPANCSSQA